MEPESALGWRFLGESQRRFTLRLLEEMGFDFGAEQDRSRGAIYVRR
jgi:hypothetical protein